MRRIRLTLLLAMMFPVLVPCSAAAFSWWDLDALSGPKFSGLVFEVRLFCIGEGKKPVISGLGAVLSLCDLPAGQRRRASLDLNLGLLKSEAHPLFAGGKSIDWTMLSVSYSVEVWGPFEVGVAVGNGWFSGDRDRQFHQTDHRASAAGSPSFPDRPRRGRTGWRMASRLGSPSCRTRDVSRRFQQQIERRAVAPRIGFLQRNFRRPGAVVQEVSYATKAALIVEGSPHHPITPSPHHPITPSPRHPVTPSTNSGSCCSHHCRAC